MNLKKITDEALYQGTFVLGNDNDRVNVVNRVCPGISEEQMNELFGKLEELGLEPSQKLFFVLSNETIENSIFDYPVNGMTLSFRKATDTLSI